MRVRMLVSLFLACGGGAEPVASTPTPAPPAPLTGGADLAHAPAEAATALTLEPGNRELVQGRLEPGDHVLPQDGSLFDAITVTVTEPGTLLVSMQSSEFDAYLIVIDGQGHKIGEDDDGGGMTDALLSLPIGGAETVTVLANSYTRGETGAYVVELEWGPPGQAPPPEEIITKRHPEEADAALSGVAAHSSRSPP